MNIDAVDFFYASSSFKGGFGVMFDDIVAAFITLLALAIYIHAFD